MGRGLACPVTAASLGAALARHTVGAQCMGLELLSFHHTAELTDVSSFTKVTCALQVKDPQSSCPRFCGANALSMLPVAWSSLSTVGWSLAGLTWCPFMPKAAATEPRDSQRRIHFALVPIFLPLLPFISVPAASYYWLQQFNVLAGLWQSQWQNVREPRSQCPLLKFLSVQFHVVGALATGSWRNFIPTLNHRACASSMRTLVTHIPALSGREDLSLSHHALRTWLISCALSHNHFCRIESNFLEMRVEMGRHIC